MFSAEDFRILLPCNTNLSGSNLNFAPIEYTSCLASSLCFSGPPFRQRLGTSVISQSGLASCLPQLEHRNASNILCRISIKLGTIDQSNAQHASLHGTLNYFKFVRVILRRRPDFSTV